MKLYDSVNTFTPSLPVNCETPEQPVNGSVSVEGQAPHPLGSEVTYHCDDGLLPTGVMTSTCTDVGGRGEWVPELMCRAPGKLGRFYFLDTLVECAYSKLVNQYTFSYLVNCRLPEEPQHGFIMNYCNLTTTEGSVITFQCDSGFSPAAKMTATCNSSEQWSTDPSQLVCTWNNGENWISPYS